MGDVRRVEPTVDRAEKTEDLEMMWMRVYVSPDEIVYQSGDNTTATADQSLIENAAPTSVQR